MLPSCMLEKILRMKSTTIIAQQRWEENQVPPGVPICLTREKRMTLREIGRCRGSLIRTRERLKEKKVCGRASVS
jgi:hypothetical protein